MRLVFEYWRDNYVSKYYILHYHQNAVQGFISLTHGTMEQVELAQFFWHHLEYDIIILGKAVGKSEDDVCMLLHLILKKMATKAPAECEYSLHFCLCCVNSIASPRSSAIIEVQRYSSLLTAKAREEWEKCFEQEYIQPVLSVSARWVGSLIDWLPTCIVNTHTCAHTHTHTHTQSLDKQISDALELIINEKKEGESTDTTLNQLTFFTSSTQNNINCSTLHTRSHP